MNKLAEKIDSSEASAIERIEGRFEKRLIEVKLELKEDLFNLKSDLIKWMVTLILGQTLAITGIFIGLIRFFK